MAIRKVKGLESSFSILPNHTINAPLSWSAKGLLAYLLSKPDDWSVSITQIINHSNLSSRPTKKKGTYAIINELMVKGYIQRGRTSGGGYSKTEYTVSSIPIEVKPLTDNRLAVKEPLQSKELYKENIKDTDNYSSNNRFYIGRLNQEDFDNCYKACDELTMYSGVFAGCLSIEEWETCEEAMRSVDEFNHNDYFEWWIAKYAKSFTKKPSLPNMLCDVNGISFDRFYETVFLNEFE